MKTSQRLFVLIKVFFWTFLCNAGTYEQLELTDGRVLKNARLFSMEGQQAVFIYEGGILNVDTNLLPQQILNSQINTPRVAEEKPAESVTNHQDERLFRLLNTTNIGNVKNSTEALINVYTTTKAPWPAST
jgi:hypothetical protein